jgi:hypothetical protein
MQVMPVFCLFVGGGTCWDMILATGVPDDPASLPHAYRRLGVD